MEGMDYVYLAQDKNNWRAIVNTKMNLFTNVNQIDALNF